MVSRSAQRRTHQTLTNPIDLDDDSDSVEEDASASLSKIDEQEEIPEENFCFNGNNAKTAQLSKEREIPERRILPQQWTFLNTNSDF